MKIAIVGGGWLGCHIANTFKLNNNITLYEEKEIFNGVSRFNQNRLHLGYHYARSFKTRDLCIKTFDRFSQQYDHLIKDIGKNLYAIPEKESNIDFQTYLKIFDNYNFEIIKNHSFLNIEGVISVKEKYIDNEKAKLFFTETLKNNIIYKKINKDTLLDLSKTNDLVIDCTNNKFYINKTIKRNVGDIFFYENISNINFSSLTLVDGNLFSIFPYKDNIFSITDVIITTDNTKNLEEKINSLENKILFYYDNFLNDFKYLYNQEIIRSKQHGMSDSRVPEITINENIISCFTGKIQGIYYVEDYLRNNYNV